MSVVVSFQGVPAPRPRGLAAVGRQILAACGEDEQTELSILLTTDEHIAELNKTWRGVEGPTDVLSFSLRDGEGAQPGEPLGDVVISLPYATRQAATRGWSVRYELEFLLLHGILHLTGWDHAEAAEAQAMEARTTLIWEALHPRTPLPRGFLT